VEIFSPAEGEAIDNDRLFLHGTAFSPDFGTTRSEDMLWVSDRDGIVGVGHETWSTPLSGGHHRLILAVPDGRGGTAEQSREIDIPFEAVNKSGGGRGDAQRD
jgi:hypothetical protein